MFYFRQIFYNNYWENKVEKKICGLSYQQMVVVRMRSRKCFYMNYIGVVWLIMKENFIYIDLNVKEVDVYMKSFQVELFMNELFMNFDSVSIYYYFGLKYIDVT